MTLQGDTPTLSVLEKVPVQDLHLTYDQMEDKKNQVKSKADFKKALIVGLIMITAQATGGILSNSVAIFADAAHLGSQALGIVVSLSAIRYAETAPDQQYSYGWQRAGLLGSLIGIVSVWILTAWLVFQASVRLAQDELERP